MQLRPMCIASQRIKIGSVSRLYRYQDRIGIKIGLVSRLAEELLHSIPGSVLAEEMCIFKKTYWKCASRRTLLAGAPGLDWKEHHRVRVHHPLAHTGFGGKGFGTFPLASSTCPHWLWGEDASTYADTPTPGARIPVLLYVSPMTGRMTYGMTYHATPFAGAVGCLAHDWPHDVPRQGHEPRSTCGWQGAVGHGVVLVERVERGAVELWDAHQEHEHWCSARRRL